MIKFFKNFKNLDGSDWDKNLSNKIFTTESYDKLFKIMKNFHIKPFYHNNQLAKNIDFLVKFLIFKKLMLQMQKIANEKALNALNIELMGLSWFQSK